MISLVQNVEAKLTLWLPSGPGLERSINNIIEKIGPNKKVDLFECARYVRQTRFNKLKFLSRSFPVRVDPNTPIEETISTLNKYGKYAKNNYGINLSLLTGRDS